MNDLAPDLQNKTIKIRPAPDDQLEETKTAAVEIELDNVIFVVNQVKKNS